LDEKYEVRGVFEKKGRAVFISHLDLFRTMQRAMKRSGIPVWYSQGFNPRIYLNFPLALSLGVESSTEIMDFEITEKVPYGEMLNALNNVLPEGLHFLSMAEPIGKNKDIAYAEYEFDFSSEGISAADISKAFDKMMASDKIEIEKHSKKKGMITMDIKPYIDVRSSCCDGDIFRADIVLPAGNELNINSNVFNEAAVKYSGIDNLNIGAKRTKILKSDGGIFA
jgi:radical SAM-linked protein